MVRIPDLTVLSVDQAGSNASFFGSLVLLPGNETVLVEQNDWSERGTEPSLPAPGRQRTTS